MSAAEELAIVREFLVEFYQPEPDNDLAATKAVRAYIGEHGSKWRIADALRSLLERELPPGTLMELVDSASGRLMDDDAEARRFLTMVFDDTAMDVAIDTDALDEEAADEGAPAQGATDQEGPPTRD
jgi:hypothetical protein